MYRRPEKCYASILSREVVSKTHRYTSVDVESKVDSRGMHLDASCFKANVAELSLSVDGLSSSRQKPDWYTSTAQDYGRQYTDLSVMGSVVSESAYEEELALWQGQ
eukprot:5653298-Amphidinium_carterae.5